MQIQLEFFWPPKPTREEVLERKVARLMEKHPDATYVDHLFFVLKTIKDQDFCVIQYGDNQWDYLQFTKENGILTFSFPYSITFGRRCKQRDLLELLLLRRDFHRKTKWWTEDKYDKSLFYYDRLIDEKYPELFAGFGIGNEELALGMTATIVRDIFRLRAPVDYEIKLGSWR